MDLGPVAGGLNKLVRYLHCSNVFDFYVYEYFYCILLFMVVLNIVLIPNFVDNVLYGEA